MYVLYGCTKVFLTLSKKLRPPPADQAVYHSLRNGQAHLAKYSDSTARMSDHQKVVETFALRADLHKVSFLSTSLQSPMNKLCSMKSSFLRKICGYGIARDDS
ncbi:hypothetical protein OUZ56_019872 [Daphnia magna]|uniref:Uncharacterized protein n=1 Tax=Daphnia magna TaxID=35525 RepID=A0ABQ9ZCV3_9CRUS|nr:hypothetical protein OUZ56_019872 [Daphnia magna]